MEILLELQYDWLQNKTIYHDPETLYHLTTVKTAVNFWNEEEIIEEVKGELTKTNIYKKLQLLKLPESIENEVTQKLELIEEQLQKFIELLPPNFLERNSWRILKNRIYWTSQATIDKIKTAEALTEATEIKLETRFQIAVLFYLESRINALAIQLPADYIDKNRRWFYKIVDLDDVWIAKQHFGIRKSAKSCSQCFESKLENEIASHYYWTLLSDEEKLEFMKPDFIYNTCFKHNNLNYLVFLFIHSNREIRLQFVQVEEYFSVLLQQLLDVKWLPIFYLCVKDAMKLLSADSVAQLLDHCLKRMKSTIAFKKKYVQISKIILQLIGNECPIVNLCYDSNKMVMNALCNLIEEGEIKTVKDFLESISDDWIKDRFSLCSDSLVCFIAATNKCGLLESVIHSAFPTVEERKEFLSTQIMHQILVYLILELHQMDDVDAILSLFLADLESLESYKIKFAEERGCSLCCAFLYRGQWEPAIKIVSWCFQSNEQMICFYETFYQSENFKLRFNPDTFKKSTDAIASFIRESILQSEFSINKLVVNSLVLNFSKCYKMFYCSYNPDIQILFEAMDKFLLATTHDDPKKLKEVKKELFLDKNRKLYISLPLEFFNQILEEDEHEEEHEEEKKIPEIEEFWHQMVDDLLDWICSSENSLKSKIKEELWTSEEILEAKKKLQEYVIV